MRDFHIRGKRLWIDRKTMILRGNRNLAAPQIFYRLVRAAMAELQFEGRSAEGEAENLMSKTNSENRFLIHQIVHRLVCVGQRSWIARPVGKKDSVGIDGQHFVRSCRGRDNRNGEAFLAQQAQDVLLDPII